MGFLLYFNFILNRTGDDYLELREQCLEMTLSYLSSKGLKFTMSELATSLGMSKKTIYQLFPSKEELLMAVVENGFGKVKQCENEIIQDKSLSLTEKIHRLIIVLPEQYRDMNWYRMEEVAEKYPKVYKKIQKHLESDWEPTLHLLQEGIEQGLLRKISLPVFQSMIEGSMEHFLTSSKLKEEGISYGEALDEMMTILMSGIERRI